MRVLSDPECDGAPSIPLPSRPFDAAGRAGRNAEHEQVSAAQAQVLHIVLVDDSVEDVAETRRLLLHGTERRFRITEVQTGAECLVALAQASDLPPDCLLLDFYLPDMDALELLARVADADGLPPCPVVVLTGRAAPHLGRAVLRAGAQDYIGKDWLSGAGLVRSIESAIERLAMSRELIERGKRLLAVAGKLAASEQRVRHVINSMVGFVGMLDLDGTLFEANQPPLDAAGLQREDVIGKKIWDSTWWSDNPAAQLRLKAAFARALAGEAVRYDETVRVLGSKGDHGRMTIDFMLQPVFENGELAFIVPSGFDVTARHVAERAARQSRDLTQAVIDGSSALVFAKDLEGRYFLTNRAWRDLTGLTSAQAASATDESIFGAEVASDMRETDRQALENPLPIVVEEHATLRGRAASYLSNKFALTDDKGHVYAVCGVSSDITELKRIERTLAEQDQRKDEFLATLAHELRNPLAPIRSGLELMRRLPSLQKRIEVSAMMERQVGHLVHLVDDLLDVSRVNRGKIDLRSERLTAAEIVEAALESCAAAIEDKRHTVNVRVASEPLWLHGDRTRLVQVVVNLLTNAIKYSNPGGEITVTAMLEEAHAVICVSDRGVGISLQALPTIWDMFTQVRDTLDKAQGGLGIGLSLVKQLVVLHGGTVEGHSEGPGHGSTFTVRLPLAQASAAGKVPTSPAVDDPVAAAFCGRRVLVVDDNVDNAQSLAALLEMSGHEVRTAHSGEAALDAARSSCPDVILLDIGLPGISGHEVARLLRADARTAGALLVAITGWGSQDDRRKTRDAGFDHHFTKPVDAATLEPLVAHARHRPAAAPDLPDPAAPAD